ncbi:hypothetical protein IWQ60_000365 [Tieghemiomyces parasiticus]|uniref:Cleavage and polyadenylation specificity factor subunit 2 n=1 Tax=Tieghemiomyces parasiticus TaxID=78921 RepID=A0A9W8DZ87_9FUNG|nr:hypothetical protein IWQ60_000365 [Tieghemiomyces parasiticus]
MASYVKFTALSGALNEDPLSYLLEIEDARILLDCGSTDAFESSSWATLASVIPHVDVVLLAHASVEHLGAYVRAFTTLNLRCPVYATWPVQNMGRLIMQDLFLSRLHSEPFAAFKMGDISAAFDHITPVRYRQPLHLTEAFSAGHSIGGTIWKIHKDTENIIYAVNYNHMKEIHLDGSVILHEGQILEALGRPSILITDSQSALTSTVPRKQREATFLDSLQQTLTAGHSVLIPTDTATRALELCCTIEQLWEAKRLQVPVFFLSHRSQRTFTYARSMLEWLSDSINQRFTNSRENPLDFKWIKLVHALAPVEDIPGPKVVLASHQSLEIGFARALLETWASQPGNLVLLPDRGPAGSLARCLYDSWAAGQPNGTPAGPVTLNTTLELAHRRRVLLAGAELYEYRAAERQKQEQEASQAALLARSKALLEDAPGRAGEDDEASDVSEAEVDDEDIEDLLFRQHDLFIREPTLVGGVYHAAQTFRMFPYIERRKRFDDYGEIIDPNAYTKDNPLTQHGVLAYGTRRGAAGALDDSAAANLAEPGAEDHDGDLNAPAKYVSEVRPVEFRCQVRYVGMEGRSDGRSVVNLLNLWGPKKLVLVHGDPASTEYLAQVCLASEQITHEVLTPSVGETLNVSTGQLTLKVTLTDALFTSLRLDSLRGYQFAPVSGRLRPRDEASSTLGSAAPAAGPVPATTATTGRPVLDLIAFDQPHPFHRPVFVGDARLTHLRKILLREGFRAEFQDEGVLVCNDKVAIRKTDQGNFFVEGMLSPEYYRVRTIVYRQHAIC